MVSVIFHYLYAGLKHSIPTVRSNIPMFVTDNCSTLFSAYIVFSWAIICGAKIESGSQCQKIGHHEPARAARVGSGAVGVRGSCLSYILEDHF